MKRTTNEAGGRGLPGLVSGIEPAELAELERIWNSLELPPPAPAPPGFAGRVAARAAAGAATRLDGAVLPHLRWASAAALALGIALGGLVSAGLSGTEETEAMALALESDDGQADASLAESYLDAVADPAALAAATGAAEGTP